MIIPKIAKSRKAIRDAKIISLYATEHLTHEEIGKQFGITKQRVGKILYNNKHLLEIDIKSEKIRRYNILSRELSKAEPSKKDRIDILAEMRKECEGDSVTNIITQFLNVTPADKNESPNRLTNAL